MQSILFVCLGNICRSPLAEAAMREACVEYNLDLIIDSAGTGDWHIGRPPDPRAQKAAMQHGNIDISQYKARQISNRDFLEYDLICALDKSNLADLKAMGGNGPAQITLLLDHLPGYEGQSVKDPYYGDADDFTACWHQVNRAAQTIARRLSEKR